MKKIRPRKDGGFSLCSCPDELVGRGRCQHVLGFASVVWNSSGDLTMVDMSGNNIDIDNLQTSLDKISTSITPEKKKKILDYFIHAKL